MSDSYFGEPLTPSQEIEHLRKLLKTKFEELKEVESLKTMAVDTLKDMRLTLLDPEWDNVHELQKLINDTLDEMGEEYEN